MLYAYIRISAVSGMKKTNVARGCEVLMALIMFEPFYISTTDPLDA
jgi:hypothetical protein